MPEVTTMEKLRDFNSRGKITPADAVHIGTVVDMEDIMMENIHEFELPYSSRSGHFGCLGTTRVGKTKLVTHMITQDIHAGNNVVFIDPKGDDEALSAVVQAAIESGRMGDLMVITPIYPECSLMIDPLAYYYLSDELVDHVISGIKSDDEYFINVASEVTTAIVVGIIAQNLAKGRETKMNFFDVKQRVDYESLGQLGEALQYLANHPNPIVRELVEEATLNIRQIRNSPQDFFAKVSSSLRTILTALTSSTTGKIIGKAKTNEFVRRFESGEGVILVCQTGSLLARRTASTIGRVLISMIQSMVGRFFASGARLKRPLCLYIDEGHNVLYQGIQELFNKAGGAGVWLHFFTQSISQIEEAVGKPTAQSIMDNISTWVYMRVNHNATATFIEEASPKRKRFDNMLSMGDAKLSITLREVEDYIIKADRVTCLRPQYFYLRTAGTFYKGRVANVPSPKMRIKFPEINPVLASKKNQQTPPQQPISHAA